jgi:hypothetical protein
MMRMWAPRELSAWRLTRVDLAESASSRRNSKEKDASFTDASLLCLRLFYQVELSQPRSSIAFTTREIATMYAASRM